MLADAQAVAVHHSYPRHEIAGGLQLELGDLYAREPKLVLLEFLVTQTAGDEVAIASRRELLLLEAARIRTEILADQQRGTFELASEKMRSMAAKLREAGLDDAVVQEEAADFTMMADQMASGAWSMAETKYTHQRSYDSSRATRLKSDIISRSKRDRDKA